MLRHETWFRSLQIPCTPILCLLNCCWGPVRRGTDWIPSGQPGCQVASTGGRRDRQGRAGSLTCLLRCSAPILPEARQSSACFSGKSTITSNVCAYVCSATCHWHAVHPCGTAATLIVPNTIETLIIGMVTKCFVHKRNSLLSYHNCSNPLIWP